MLEQLTIFQEPAVLTKKCGKCEAIKPLAEFTIDNRKKYGVGSNCKLCDRVYKRAWWHSPAGQAYYKSKTNTERWKAQSQTPEYKEKQSRRQKTYDVRIQKAKKRLEQKLKAFKILGGVRCSSPNCLVFGGCNDIRALQLDHKAYCGRKNRQESRWLYRWIIEHPTEACEKFQVLCANCNTIKKYEKGEGIKYSPENLRLPPIS